MIVNQDCNEFIRIVRLNCNSNRSENNRFDYNHRSAFKRLIHQKRKSDKNGLIWSYRTTHSLHNNTSNQFPSCTFLGR